MALLKSLFKPAQQVPAWVSFRMNISEESPEESTEVTKVFEKDPKDIRSSLKPEVSYNPTRVVVLAISKNALNNRRAKIYCDGSLPIPGYSYTSVNDACMVACSDHADLGLVDISYRISMRGVSGWKIAVPVPPQVIRRYLSFEQRKLLRLFQDQFKGDPDGYDFEFLQMTLA